MRIFLILCWFSTSIFLFASVGELTIPKVANTPAPGKWSPVDFNRALTISGAVSAGRNASIPRLENCQFRLLHDGNTLAIFAQIQIPPHVKLTTEKNKRDDDIDKDDSIELFFTPGTADAPVYQVLVNSAGVVLDLRLSAGHEEREWNCAVEVETSATRGIWNAQLRIPMLELGLASNQPFRFNAVINDRFRARNQHWSGAYVKAGYKEYDKQFIMRLGTKDTSPSFHLCNPYAEQLHDGHFEYDPLEFTRIGSVYRSRYRQYDGTYSIMFTATESSPTAELSRKLPSQPGDIWRVYGTAHLNAVEQPNFSPASVAFHDAEGSLLAKDTSPGLGNSGGSTTPAGKHLFCEFTATAPPRTASATMIWSLNGTTGVMRVDALSFRKNFPQWNAPALLAPAYDLVSFAEELSFTWSEPVSAGREAVYILEISPSPDFQKGTIRIVGAWPGCKQSLRPNGKWHWRVGLKKGEEIQWSDISEFSVDCRETNEKNPPKIISMIPFGFQKNCPDVLEVTFQDPGVSAGIDSQGLQLIVNDCDVTPECRSEANRLTWRIPPQPEGKPVHYNVKISDRNHNSISRNGWFLHGKKPAQVGLDSAGFITRNGRRIFPLGMYGMSKYDVYPAMKSGGLDTNFCPWGNTEATIAHLNIAFQNDMYVVAFVPGHGRILAGEIPADSAIGQKFEEEALDKALKIMDHPSLLGFYIGDENIDAGGAKPEFVRDWYRLLKKNAPNQLVYWLPTYQLRNPSIVSCARNACDVLVWHDYGYNLKKKLRPVQTLKVIEPATGNMPHFMLPEAFKYGVNGRFPPREEIRFQCFLGIISGTRGLSFYTSSNRRNLGVKDPYADDEFPNYLEEIFTVSRELAALSDALTADDLHTGFDVVAETGALRTLGKKAGGKLYVFAVNAEPSDFRGKIVSDWKQVKLDGLSVAVENGAVNLTLPSGTSALLEGK